MNAPSIVEYQSKASAAGIVHVMLGYVPDFALHIADHGGTNPNVHVWVNPKFIGSGDAEGWPVALSLLITGSTGVITRDTTGITAYTGGEVVASAETVDTAGKHVDRQGVGSAAGVITRAGLSIPADHQVASGRNVLIAFRADFGSGA